MKKSKQSRKQQKAQSVHFQTTSPHPPPLGPPPHQQHLNAVPLCCQQAAAAAAAASCPGCYPQPLYPSGGHHPYLAGPCSCQPSLPSPQQIYQNASHQVAGGQQPPAISKPTNIVATMELFEPRSTGQSRHQDYSYAYYEPGVALRHSNVPSYMFDPSGSSALPGPSSSPRTPPQNAASASSMRTLMALGGSNGRNRLYGRRSGSVGRFPGSPCENIYEEIIHEENEPHQSMGASPGPSGRLSLASLNQSVIVEEEFRQVQQCHRKVLGELNLSVEAMLMPTGGSPVREQDEGEYQRGSLGGYGGRRRSYTSGTVADMDSGFSGSSGGTSYIGNLRARKTEARMLSLQQQAHHQSMVLFEGFNSGSEDTRSVASCHSVDRPKGGLCKGKNLSKLLSGSTRSLKKMLDGGGSETKNKHPIAGRTHSTPSSPTFVKSTKVGFWSKKSWTKKLSSSGALHLSFEDDPKPYPTADTSWDDSGSGRDLLAETPPTTAAAPVHQRQLSAPDTSEFLRGQLIPYPGAGQDLHQNQQQSQRNTKLDYKPSTRTVSSEDSCYSEERYISSSSEDDDEDELDLDENDIREEYLRHHHHHNRNHLRQQQQPKSGLLKSASSVEVIGSNQEQSDRRRSITQLQNTLNKAKYHLSFDKWKSHHGGSNNSSSNGASNQQQQQQHRTSLPATVAGGGAGGNVLLTDDRRSTVDLVNNNNSRNSIHAPTMSSTTSSPAHPSVVAATTTTGSPSPSLGMSPGSAASPPSAGSSPSIASSEPFSRLSRWFSIRRGSMNQYDVKGNSGAGSTVAASGKENRRNSIDHVDSTSIGYGSAKFDAGKSAMGKVLEAEEDPLQLALDSFAMTRGPGVVGGAEVKAAERRHIPVALPPAPTGLTQQQLKRRLIVAAIVHSENSYVASLQRLVNEYKRPLEESSPPILNASKTATLFHRLPEILQLHTLFRISLADYIQSWDTEEKIGDVFVATFSKSLVLEVYSGFINNFSIAMDLARMEAKRKSALSDFFKVKQISSHDRLSFFGLMVKPVQRFPQFILFLQDLLKYTPQGHHDRMSLQLALTQLESLAEMLNERKREAEQFQAFKEMLENISGTFNIRSLVSGGGADNTINSNNTRYLLREDNVTQLEFNQSGFIVKSKKRRLLLLNDKVLCVSVAPKQSHEFGSSEKLTFKWMHPVQDVEIVDNNQSITLSRILTAGMKRGNSLKSNSSFDSPHIGPGMGGLPGSASIATASTTCNNSSTMNSSFGGGPGATLPGSSEADNLCGEMNDLMHDYEVMSRINDLVGSLKGSYREINLGVTKSILADIQASIQRKDEEISWVDSCCLQLVLKNAAKGGKEDVTYTFQIENPVVKKDWITELRLAQLALDPNNSPAWQIGAEHEQRYSLAKMPLFVKAYPAYKSQHQTEVCCGCYFSSNLASNLAASRHTGGGPRPSSRKRSKHSNTLWICSTDKINSHLTILAHNSAAHQSNGGFGEVARFSLAETIVTCMEYVKEGGLMSGDEPTMDTVWIGTNNHRVLIYAASYPMSDEQLVNLALPGVPSQMLYFNERVFVGMTDGRVLVFGKGASGGIWNLNGPKVLAVQAEAISSLLAINSSVYFGAGKHVYVINGRTAEVEKSFHVKHSTGGAGNVAANVNLLAHSGIGLWISLKNSSIICLYHTETFKHLQDINIASNVLRVTSSHQNPSRESASSSIQVTALMAAKGMLWVGTNVGITLTIPLPRLEGVPIISGGVNISYHAHLGPVTFLLPLVTRSYHALPAEGPKTAVQDVPDGSKVPEQKNEPETVDRAGEDPEKAKEAAATTLKQQICSSPVILRRKKPAPMDAGRMAKTLPRNLRTSSGAFSPSIHSTLSSSSQYSDQGCDVYGLYSDLIFVKEDIENTEDRNILDPSYDYLRRSDPDIAAIPAKVSTLDRRLRMKVSRPRSLDLSNWSMESRSSSVYTSSGSDENVGSRSGSGSKNVSRNSSSASHKMNNTSDLDNIAENEVVPPQSSELNAAAAVPKESAEPAEKFPTHTGKRKKTQSISANGNAGGANGGATEATARRTILTLTGGRGYVNWRHIWERADAKCGAQNSPQNHQRTGSVTSLAGLGQTNSTDAHVIIWEKKL